MVFDKLKSIFGGMGKEEKEEMETLSVGEVKKSLKDRKSHLLQDIEKDQQPTLKKTSNIRKKIENLNKKLRDTEPEDNVHPNIYRSAEEGKNLLTNTVGRAVEKMKVPSDPTWDGLLGFKKSLKSAVDLLQSAVESHGKQVGALFGDEMSRLNNLTDELRSASKELDNSLEKAEHRVENLNEILEKISKREGLLERKKDLKERQGELEHEKEEVESRLNKDENRLESLEKSERFEELEEVKERIEELSRKKKGIHKELDSTISELSRPLRKMRKMIERDEHMVSREVLDALNSYHENPAQTALDEEKNLPKLSAMLQELETVLDGKMKLDEKEREKRLQEVRDITENEKVKRLREEYYQIKNEIDSLKGKRKESPLLEKRERLQESIKAEKSEINRLKDKIKEKKRELETVSKQIVEKSEVIKEKAESILHVRVENL